jgi:hypothetical protein
MSAFLPAENDVGATVEEQPFRAASKRYKFFGASAPVVVIPDSPARQSTRGLAAIECIHLSGRKRRIARREIRKQRRNFLR